MSRSHAHHRRLLKACSCIALASVSGCASFDPPLPRGHAPAPMAAAGPTAAATSFAEPPLAAPHSPALPASHAMTPVPAAPLHLAPALHAAVDPGVAAADPGVAPVGYFVGDAAPVCGCASCTASGAQGAVPHGYAYQATPWNLYGIDGQEFLCDGGDHPPEVIVRRDDSLAGLDLEDTVVHYTTEQGDVHVEPSNRTCLYAPRFASVRKFSSAYIGDGAVGAAGINKPIAAGNFEIDLPGLVVRDSMELAHADVANRLDAVRDRNRGVRVDGLWQPVQATDILTVVAGLSVLEIDQLRDTDLALLREAAQAAITWAIDESVEVAIADVAPPTLVRDQSVEGFTVYDFPDAGRLRIGKLADRHDALPGEIVTFMLRVDNVGDSAVSDVVVTDNLTTRLEYIEGSQTASGGAIFNAERNEGESQQLTWKLTDRLRVGESVTIRFRCRVR